MKIGIFTNTYWPSLNGVAVSIANLREGLERLGHETIVIAPKVPGFDHSVDHPGIIRFPSFAPPQKPDYPLALPIPPPGAIKRMLCFRPDVIHINHPWWVGKWGIWWAKYQNVPIMLTVHTQYGLYAGYSPLPDDVTRELMEMFLVKSCEMVDLVTTPGEGSRKRLLGLGIKTPIELVSNPTKLAEFMSASGSSVRRHYGIGEDEILLGYVGRLTSEKNLETLIEAFGFIAQSKRNVRLMIVGDGSERQALKKLAAEQAPDRVIFAGSISHDQIAPFFAAFNLFVTPSKSEVQPMSFAEAFAASTPIVAFDVPGCNDMIESGTNGVLVALGSGAQGLAEAVLLLIGDQVMLAALGERACQWSSRYGQMAAVETMVRVYERLLG